MEMSGIIMSHLRQIGKWILAGFGFVLISLLSFQAYRYLVLMKLPADLQQKAELAFARGITILDESNDFAWMGTGGSGGKPNNPTGYNLGFNDLKSITLGADDQYIYIKVMFWGTIPDLPPNINGDMIGSTVMKLNFTNEQGVDQAIWMLSFGYLPVVNLTTTNTYYFYGPTGIQEPEDKRFSGRGTDSQVIGGAGYDHLIGALPLKGINLNAGQTVNLCFSVETASDKYDHASVDVLGGHGKMPALITWKLGSDSYQINHDFFNP